MSTKAKDIIPKKNRIKNDGLVFDIVNITLLVIILLLLIYPLYFTVIASLSEPKDVVAGKVLLAPVGFTSPPVISSAKRNCPAGIGSIFSS